MKDTKLGKCKIAEACILIVEFGCFIIGLIYSIKALRLITYPTAKIAVVGNAFLYSLQLILSVYLILTTIFALSNKKITNSDKLDTVTGIISLVILLTSILWWVYLQIVFFSKTQVCSESACSIAYNVSMIIFIVEIYMLMVVFMVLAICSYAYNFNIFSNIKPKEQAVPQNDDIPNTKV